MTTAKLLEIYKKHMIVKDADDFAIVGLPFFHLGHPDGIALRFAITNGNLVVSDCRTTVEYLDANNIDLNDYPNKLATIMSKFDIFLDGNVFRKIIYNADNQIALCRDIGYFIEAVSLIAHIDL